MQHTTSLVLELDGVAVPNLKTYLDKSDVFSVTLPANNLFGLPTGLALSPSADEGYYVAISSWGTGSHHTVHLHAVLANGFSNDVTYNITLQ